MTALEASMGEATVYLVPKGSVARARATGLVAIGFICMADLAHAHQASDLAESLSIGTMLLTASTGQQVLQEPLQDSVFPPRAATRDQPEAFHASRAPSSLRMPALQIFSLRAAYAPDRLRQADGPTDTRLGPRPVEGWRVVEVSPVFDPLRPFQRPSRALEMPAAGTTAFAQELGLPMRACIHRFRVPSRIRDNGSFSIKAQWNVGCRF